MMWMRYLIWLVVLLTAVACKTSTPKPDAAPSPDRDASSAAPAANLPTITPTPPQAPSHAQALAPLTLLPADDPLTRELLMALGCPKDAISPDGCGVCAGALSPEPLDQDDDLGQATLVHIVLGQLTEQSGDHALVRYSGCADRASGDHHRVLLHRAPNARDWSLIARSQYNDHELCYALKGPHAATQLVCHGSSGQQGCYGDWLYLPNLPNHAISSLGTTLASSRREGHYLLDTFDECEDAPEPDEDGQIIASPHTRITLQIADLDGDGDDDVIITHNDQTYHLIQHSTSLTLQTP